MIRAGRLMRPFEVSTYVPSRQISRGRRGLRFLGFGQLHSHRLEVGGIPTRSAPGIGNGEGRGTGCGSGRVPGVGEGLPPRALVTKSSKVSGRGFKTRSKSTLLLGCEAREGFGLIGKGALTKGSATGSRFGAAIG